MTQNRRVNQNVVAEGILDAILNKDPIMLRSELSTFIGRFALSGLGENSQIADVFDITTGLETTQAALSAAIFGELAKLGQRVDALEAFQQFDDPNKTQTAYNMLTTIANQGWVRNGNNHKHYKTLPVPCPAAVGEFILAEGFMVIDPKLLAGFDPVDAPLWVDGVRAVERMSVPSQGVKCVFPNGLRCKVGYDLDYDFTNDELQVTLKLATNKGAPIVADIEAFTWITTSTPDPTYASAEDRQNLLDQVLQVLVPGLSDMGMADLKLTGHHTVFSFLEKLHSLAQGEGTGDAMLDRAFGIASKVAQVGGSFLPFVGPFLSGTVDFVSTAVESGLEAAGTFLVETLVEYGALFGAEFLAFL
jgi:hypothetical protein